MRKVSELFKLCDDLIILHGISKCGALSDIPKDVKFIDQIVFSIKNLVSTFSFTFGEHNIENHAYSRIGIIIKEGKILGQKKEDAGSNNLANSLINGYPNENMESVLFSNRVCYNEIILEDIEICGIWINALDICDYSWIEINDASKKLNLLVYWFNAFGLLSTYWDENLKEYKADGTKILKFKDIFC